MSNETNLEENGQPNAPLADEHFEVRDQSSANWLTRKILEARRYASRVEEWAAAEITRTNRDEEWLLYRFGRQLEDWAAGELNAWAGRGRSIQLPAGQVGFRRLPSGLRVIDKHALSVWCRSNLPETYRLRVDSRGKGACLLWAMFATNEHGFDLHEDVLVSGVQQHVESTGEVPPGTEVTAVKDRFYVR